MKINELKKKSYAAPKMEATSFRSEKGYAASPDAGQSVSAKITMFGSSL
ncbi:MAG: hypothetical protein Q4F69_02330 [Bacteroidia bacterium]|nr:hypothetical protein [Bacteroidia bacterium]